VLPAITLAQQPTELNIGWLRYSAGTISQHSSVQNNGLLPIKTVRMGYRFSHFFVHYSKQLLVVDSNEHMLESKSAASLLGDPTSNNLAQN
jgi:hypothetical protein